MPVSIRMRVMKWFAAAMMVLAFAPISLAQNALERLVSPGEVIAGHAKWEKDCASCHEPFSRASQSKLCLDCHKEIAADVRGKAGFHGIRKEVSAAACSHCHTDHKGRKFDIVQFDALTFDHTSTDFALVGAHLSVKCDSCHVVGKKFRETSSLCIDCHKKDDPHKGSLGDKCETCHDAKTWRETKHFNHDTANFKLTGAHTDAKCASCHAGERWKGAPVLCNDCHRQQDKHKGQNGQACETCHTTKNWKEITFNHDRDTKFPLLGKHLPAKCESCHTKDPKLEKLAITCMPCHTKDDVHNGSLGKECQKCHNESGWKIGVLFDHDKDTKFKLADKHVTTKCADCHTTKDYRDAPKTCVGCHKKKDIHIGRLGPKCEDCHNAANWKQWKYDHATQAHYPLTGAHATTSCYACHTQQHAEKVVTPKTCNGCHRNDDIHRGAFGTACDKCHSTKKFLPAVVPR
jgi:Cytochrome c7 and related cytochrome c